ncbi:hypothetical protein ACFYYB_33615 [Streptomyces sp. NPDC002886]|uniref:hypothetical protein n=1 Tax=Streptomyces sp. NPDC002886 TaxID=3364667 RepID=UPI00367CF8E3
MTGFSVRCRPDAVEIAVSDASPDLPRTPGTLAFVPGGFGWLVINRLAARTEISASHERKTITAYVTLAGAAPDA